MKRYYKQGSLKKAIFSARQEARKKNEIVLVVDENTGTIIYTAEPPFPSLYDTQDGGAYILFDRLPPNVRNTICYLYRQAGKDYCLPTEAMEFIAGALSCARGCSLMVEEEYKIAWCKLQDWRRVWENRK